MEMIPSPRLGFLRGVFLANHWASNDNLTIEQPKDRTNTDENYQCIKGALISNDTIKSC